MTGKSAYDDRMVRVAKCGACGSAWVHVFVNGHEVLSVCSGVLAGPLYDALFMNGHDVIGAEEDGTAGGMSEAKQF